MRLWRLGGTPRRPGTPPDPSQIELPLLASPEAFRARLAAAGLGAEWKVTVTDNRATMVSFNGQAVRVHRVYLTASDPVIAAIARFVTTRRRDVRREAVRMILAHAPGRNAGDVVPLRRPERTHPADLRHVERLTAAHRDFNARYFDSGLRSIPVRVSRRMKRRLGQYCASEGEIPGEIAISRRHIRDDGWEDVLHTLLHEMVHQWQDESGLPLAHDRAFRRKAREVGADPRATRPHTGNWSSVVAGIGCGSRRWP